MFTGDGLNLYDHAVATRGDPTTMLVLADWLDEQGRAAEAYAWRWAGRHRKWPFSTAGGRDVYWQSTAKLGMKTVRPFHLHQYIIMALPPGPRTNKKYASPHEALEALGQALASLLKAAGMPG